MAGKKPAAHGSEEPVSSAEALRAAVPERKRRRVESMGSGSYV